MSVSTGQGDEDVMATINITPFTDVLLVLLIIFIILTSVTKEPKLPDALNRDKVQDSQIVVLIDAKDKVSIGSHEVTIQEAGAAFRKLSEDTGHRYKNVIIKADPNASYGIVLQVMDAAKSADLTNFGLANHVQGEPEGAR